jgi:hypothetical protein
MIKTFRSRGAELLFARKSVALFQAIELAHGVKLIGAEKAGAIERGRRAPRFGRAIGKLSGR